MLILVSLGMPLGSALPATAAETSPGLVVELSVRRQLALVEHTWSAGPGEVTLEGHLVVTVTNRSSVERRLRDLDAQGLVFTDITTGRVHPIVHPCACVRDLREGPRPGAMLQPGAQTTFALDEWGCGGGAWRAPPPGRYRVEYRVLQLPASSPPPAVDDRPPHALVEECRRQLASEAFWRNAARSKPLQIRLEPPVRKWIR